MRRILSLTLIACCLSFPSVAQSLNLSTQEKPQIAYHLFSTWADNYMVNARRGKTISESILFSTGALALGSAALVYYGGDQISMDSTGSPMNPTIKQNVSMGLGIGGGALIISGMIVQSVPIKDYRAIYSDIFREKDPEVQEAMAVSVLRYQADRGKERRITSVVSGLLVPILAGAIQAGVNLAQGDEWSRNVFTTIGNSSWWMAGSIVSLFQKSPEERLYDRYLTTRDAYFGQAK